jgi:WD40 repeat protein
LVARVFDLESFLVERGVDNTTLLAFYHRQVRAVVVEDYLAGEAKQQRHRKLAEYFDCLPLYLEAGRSRIANIRKLAELPYQQAHAGLGHDLIRTLTDLAFMSCCVSVAGPQSLLDAYDLARLPGLIPETEVQCSLRSIQRAIQTATYILIHDPTQLAGQLLGRITLEGSPTIHKLLVQAEHWKGAPWLRPLYASLSPPGGPLLFTLSGHGATVETVVVTPDGRLAISGSDDGTAKVWDIERGRELYTLAGHEGWVKHIVVTPDGRRAVSAADSNILKVWDLSTGIELHTLQGDFFWTHAVAVRLTAVD